MWVNGTSKIWGGIIVVLWMTFEWSQWVELVNGYYLQMFFIDRVKWVVPLKEKPHHTQTTIFSFKAAVCEEDNDASQCLLQYPTFLLCTLLWRKKVLSHSCTLFLNRFNTEQTIYYIPSIYICIKTTCLFAVVSGLWKIFFYFCRCTWKLCCFTVNCYCGSNIYMFVVHFITDRFVFHA